MANYITTSVSWDGQQTLDVFYKPYFIGKDPILTQGVRVIPNVQSSTPLNFFSRSGKILKAYSKGFSGSTGETYTQKTITVYRMKGEISQDAQAFYDTVFETALKKGVEWNDITGTVIENIIMTVFLDGIKSDIYRQFWLNDLSKETVSGGFKTGKADVNYNSFDGIWRKLIKNSSTNKLLSSTKIYHKAMAHGSVAQVDTVTLATGGVGTAIITLDGIAYTVTVATGVTLASGAANFVTTYATSLAARDVTVTSSGAGIIFTSSIAGQPFSCSNAVNATGTLAGTRAATTANTAPSALTTDEAITYIKDLYENSNIELRQLAPEEKVFLVTSDVYYNIEDYLSTITVNDSFKYEVDGIRMMKWRGIAIIDMGWDYHLQNDFLNPYPSRIIYTALGNLVLALDAFSEFNTYEMWYNKDEQENRFRMQLKMGADYVFEALTSVSY